MDGFRARSHDDDYPFGLRMARVFEETIAAACPLCEACHQPLDYIRAGVVKEVRGLAGLKEYVGILRRAAEHGTVRSEGALAVGFDGCFGDETAQVIIAEFFNLRYFM